MAQAAPGQRRRLVLFALLWAALLPAAAWSQPGLISGRWRQGVFPVASFVRFTSHYGSRIGPGGSVEPHYGLDIAAPLGSAIHSWWGGVVQEVINDGACGVGLVIRSGPYEHIYCHLAGGAWGGAYHSGPVMLRQGQAVATGQLIGHVGLSGRTTGPHLHWGVRHRGQWLDPARVLRAMVASRVASKRQPAPRVGGI
ncbi:MAG: M23 family metallopeptidase [Cyanobacteriota bacterium]|nr:M23 family metallopeptidase [Cyanobacteriota bacterium]